MSKRLQQIQANNKKLLVTFITAGDLDNEQTIALMHAMVEKGVDIIELGVPFSDPMADGAVIQRSSERALARGTTLKTVLEITKTFREKNQVTPIIFMGYANPIERYGWEAFLADAKANGVDGLLMVDYPPEAMAEWVPKLQEADIDPIFLVAPTTSKERMALIAKASSGFIYFVSLKGVTGSDRIDLSSIRDQIDYLKSLTDLPVVAGFGIRDRETASNMAQMTDGVVIGSRIIELIEQSPTGADTQPALEWLGDIREALNALGDT